MNNKALFYEGGSRAVLLFHAFTSNSKDMLSLGRALERAGYTVYAPVFSGHGTGNPDDLFDYTIKDWVQDGRDALSFLRGKGYEEIAIFGLSLGGIVATTLLLEEDVKGGGTFAAPVISKHSSNVPENFMAWFEAMKKHAGHTEAEIAGLKTAAEVKLENILNGMNEHIATIEQSYGTLDKKIFVAQGAKDEMIDKENGVDFRDALTSADVDFHWYDEGPHVLTTGRIGKELQVDLLSFLSSLDWNGD